MRDNDIAIKKPIWQKGQTSQGASIEAIAAKLESGKISYSDFTLAVTELRKSERQTPEQSIREVSKRSASPRGLVSSEIAIPATRSPEGVQRQEPSTERAAILEREAQDLRQAVRAANAELEITRGELKRSRDELAAETALKVAATKSASLVEQSRTKEKQLLHETAQQLVKIKALEVAKAHLLDQHQSAMSEIADLQARFKDLVTSRTALETEREEHLRLLAGLASAESERNNLRAEQEVQSDRLEKSLAREATLAKQLDDVEAERSRSAALQDTVDRLGAEVQEARDRANLLVQELDQAKALAANAEAYQAQVLDLEAALAKSREQEAHSGVDVEKSQALETEIGLLRDQASGIEELKSTLEHSMHANLGLLDEIARRQMALAKFQPPRAESEATDPLTENSEPSAIIAGIKDDEVLKALSTAVENELARQTTALAGVAERESTLRTEFDAADPQSPTGQSINLELALRESHRDDLQRRIGHLNELLQETILSLRQG